MAWGGQPRPAAICRSASDRTRRGANVSSRRAADRRLARQGCRPGRRVLPRQGARPPRLSLLLGTWSRHLGGCRTERSCPLVLNRLSFAGVLRCHRAGGWDLSPVVSSEFSPQSCQSKSSVVEIMCCCISGTDSGRISTCFPARSGQLCC